MKFGNFYSPYLAYNYKNISKKLCKLRFRVLISLNYSCIELSYFVIVDENYKLKYNVLMWTQFKKCVEDKTGRLSMSVCPLRRKS